MRDSRLDLGRYITNPFNRRGDITKRLDFDDLFTSKAATGEYPFNPSRFESGDLTKKAIDGLREIKSLRVMDSILYKY